MAKEPRVGGIWNEEFGGCINMLSGSDCLQMNDVTLVIPAKNEPESLPYVLMELEKLNLNFLIVLETTDHATINSIEKFKSKIIYQIEKGYGDAILLGIKNVKIKAKSCVNIK